MHVTRRPFTWTVAAAAIALALILTVALTPGGQALAQKLLQLGWYRFTQEPTLMEEWIEASEDGAPAANGRLLPRQRFESATEASDDVGFTVLYPTYLPQDYYPDDFTNPIKVVSRSSGATISASANFVYVGEGHDAADSHNYLLYEQTPYREVLTPQEMGVGEAQIRPVTVNGGDGMFLQDLVWGTSRDENGDAVPIRYNVLLWVQEVDGEKFMFWLHSGRRLPLAELRAVAESLAP